MPKGKETPFSSEPTKAALARAARRRFQRTCQFESQWTDYGDMDYENLMFARYRGDAMFLIEECVREDVPKEWKDYAWNWVEETFNCVLERAFGNSTEMIESFVETRQREMVQFMSFWWKEGIGQHIDGHARPREQMLWGKDDPRIDRLKKLLSEIWVEHGITQMDPERKGGFGHVTLQLGSDDRMVTCQHRPWLPVAERPDQREAEEYSRECGKLQTSPAGKKARALLMENLSEGQRDSYFRDGNFTVLSPSKTRYAIIRGFPNGNIVRVEYGKSGIAYATKNYCYHPAEPYPLDDIALTQKLMIENDEAEFKAKANGGALKPMPLKDVLPDSAYFQDIRYSGAWANYLNEALI